MKKPVRKAYLVKISRNAKEAPGNPLANETELIRMVCDEEDRDYSLWALLMIRCFNEKKDTYKIKEGARKCQSN